MSKSEIVFAQKLETLTETFEKLDNILDSKTSSTEHSSLYLEINSLLEQLKLLESNIATIAQLQTAHTESDFNNRINNVTTQFAPVVEKAQATLLDLETRVAEGHSIPDSDEETELQLTAPHTTFFTPMRQRRTMAPPLTLIKPPKLSIPTFDGDHKTFPTFWRQFKTIIHQDPNLNNRQKSIYLAEALKGSARVHLENKALDGTTYDRIITTLKTTYAPKLKIDYRIHDELAKLPTAKNDPTSVRCRVNEIRALLDQLETDTLYHSEDPAWVKLITTKFPIDIINMLCWRSSRATSIKQLLINIEETADSMESFSIYSSKSILIPPHHSQNSNNSKTPLNSVTSPQTKTERPCVFCNQLGHRSAKCTVITTPQQRREIIKQKNRCWICFSPTHVSTKCTFEKCKTCSRDHHPSLCLPNPLTSTPKSNPKPKAPVGVNCSVTQPPHYTPTPAYLMTSKVSIYNPQTKSYHTKILFLDPGATQSFIYEPTAKECHLRILDSQLITATGFSGSCEAFDSKTVEAVLRTPFGKSLTLTLLTSPKPLTGKLKSCRLSHKDKEILEQSNITITNQLVDGETFVPDILLGMDWCDSIIRDTKPTVLPSGLKVRNTQIGPCIYGKNLENDNLVAVNTLIINPTMPDDVMIRQLFEIDNLGISPHEGALNRSEIFFNDYSTLLNFDQGYITAPLPLKSNATRIESNRSMALATLNRLQKSLTTDMDQREHYQQTIAKYIEEGVVEHVPATSTSSMIYYMPHRGVWKPNKVKPLRVVFNASAKQKGQLSLNDVTSTGESFNNKIIDILIGIRTKKYFLMCDIEGAFTQIRITSDHKDLCRFLWLHDPNKGTTPDNILELRFNRLAFGITASPAILNMSLHAFLKNQESYLVPETLRYLYVDNIFYITDNYEDLAGIYSESKNIFSKVSMNIREYYSNHTEFNSTLPAEDKHPDLNPKILGVRYLADSDQFSVNFQLRTQNSFTKRDLLSSLHSVFDPLGLAAPFSLHFKLLLRQVMNGSIDWKQQVPLDVVNNWNNTSNKIGAAKIQIPRKLTNSSECREVWIFVDASVLAIAACAFCTSPTERTPLVMGKIKLAPKNRTLTIPRLEMSAILMGMKIAETIYDNIPGKEVTINIASDSQIALSWMFTKKSTPVFISNLRQNIEQIARKLEQLGANIAYHYVDTNNNPADIGTRGTTDLAQLQDTWLHSPSWLLDENDRPAKEFKIPLEEDEPAMLIMPVTISRSEPDNLLEPDRFSSYLKLRRTTGLVLKAALTFLDKKQKVPTSQLLKTAATEWKRSQSFNNTAEILLIQEAQNHLSTPYKKQFRLQKDQHGLICIQTRFTNSSLPTKAKFPYLLPKKSTLGKLILQFLHRTNAHAGVSQLLYLFMTKFFMASARQVCKSIIKRCVLCQRILSNPFSIEYFAPLPEDRVTRAMPFRHTGLDCIGPIKFRKNQQIYIVIFTCLTIRAVHLEPINDMSSNTFINAFIRFVARRGLPHVLRSDNGANFTHSAKILRTLEEHSKEHQTNFTSYLQDHKITWMFNTPSAPWTGGVWERLVAITKNALVKTLSLKIIDKDQLVTAIVKIEGIINSRPITYTDSENFHEHPLTPADFLTHGSPILIPVDNVDSLGDRLDQPYTITSNKQAFENLQKIEIIAEAFWNTWSKEYLLTLRHAHASRKMGRHNLRHPYQNEVVLVEEDNTNRNNWNMARVTELIPSSDNIIRTVKIKTNNGKELLKPVERLYPLELFDELTESQRKATNVNHLAYTTNSRREQSSNHFLTNILRFLVLIQLFFIASAEPMFTCSTSHVSFPSQPKPSTVCINTDCHQLPANQAEDILLPVSVIPKTTSVTRYNKNQRQSQLCHLPHPCDFPPPMILHILGNPHCNPILAILLTIAPIICLTILCITIGCIYKNCKNRQRPRAEPTVSYIPSVLFAIVAIITSVNACNEIHIRNNIELVCDDIHNCTKIKSEEIPFNPLEKSFCSVIKFQNSTIGKLEINVLSSTFTCKRVTQGYTKITNLTIHSIARCLGTGDCPWGTGCDNIRPDTFVSSLIHTYKNPGHTYCTRAGGGLFNSCGLPIEGCLLFRPTYVPETEQIYEEIKCISWIQEVNIQMKVEYVNNTHEYNLSLQPYKRYEFHGISLQISSITSQVLPQLMNSIFLVSKEESFMLPEQKKTAVLCSHPQIAAMDFKSCRIRKPCVCLAAAAQLSCNCESVSRKELEHWKLPRDTPDFTITEESKKIRLISYLEETTVTLENPNYNIENLYQNRYPCYSDFQMMTGCYKCRDGIELNVTCDTKDELYAILNCETFSKPIMCSDKNPITTIRLFYDQPNFDENCTLTCGKAQKQLIRLSAKLHYIVDNIPVSEAETVEEKGKNGIALELPHLGPIWEIITANWKWILPTVATTAIIIYLIWSTAAFLLPTILPAILTYCCFKQTTRSPPAAVSGNA